MNKNDTFEKKYAAFRKFLHNKEKNEYCDKTCKGWVLLLLYYFVSYVFMAVMFVSLMCAMLYGVLPEDYPMYYDDHNFYNEPGMSFLPQNKSGTLFHLQEYQLLVFNKDEPDTYTEHVGQLREFMKKYVSIGGTSLKNCDGTLQDGVCEFDMASFGSDCWDSDPDNFAFGYDQGSPCILFRINKMYGWKPEPLESAPADMTARFHAEKIPISCEMFKAKTLDPDSPPFSIMYLPPGGFSVHCFPFCAKKTTYPNVFVMVKLIGVQVNTLTSIMCKFHAKNVNPDRRAGTGSAMFQLVINS